MYKRYYFLLLFWACWTIILNAVVINSFERPYAKVVMYVYLCIYVKEDTVNKYKVCIIAYHSKFNEESHIILLLDKIWLLYGLTNEWLK